MNELKKGLSISLDNEKSQGILSAFEEQMAEWEMTMPPIEPLVLDFGLGDFQRIGLIEYWIANEVEAGYCGKYLFVFDGQTCPLHYHKDKIETFFIVKGAVIMSFNNTSSVMQAGSVLKVDTTNVHSFTGIGPALLLEISKPCIIDDNYFIDTRIPIGGNFQRNI